MKLNKTVFNPINSLLIIPSVLFVTGIVLGNQIIENKENLNNIDSIIEQSTFELPKLPDLEYSVQTQQTKQTKCNTQCQLIAEAIVYEARSESDSGKLKVASVILNRADHSRFPDTIKSVIHQPYQFSYINDMHLQTTPTDYDWEIAYDIANEALDGNRNTEALFYLNPKKVKKLPKWALVYSYIETEGNHDFYTF